MTDCYMDVCGLVYTVQQCAIIVNHCKSHTRPFLGPIGYLSHKLPSDHPLEVHWLSVVHNLDQTRPDIRSTIKILQYVHRPGQDQTGPDQSQTAREGVAVRSCRWTTLGPHFGPRLDHTLDHTWTTL